MSTGQTDQVVAAVNVKLARIAEVSPTPPVWYDDWLRLGSESTEEDRLAVYQAIRNSRGVPAIVGSSLVAWQIKVLVHRDAEASLQDLDESMRAMETAYEQKEGTLWPEDDVPREYAELSRQYDEAWDRIFLAKLEAFGERDMADAYRADPEEFERRCQLGLQFFDERVVVHKPPAPNELVKVTSCLDLPRAALARMALAREGIPTALGNANLVWACWDYSNAVGGITVHVRYRDAEHAREVLAVACAKPSANLPPWVCSSCGQQVAGQWDACWQCGHFADGTPSRPPDDEIAAQPEGDADDGIWQNLSRLFGLAAGLGLVILLLRDSPTTALMLAPFVVALVFLLRRFEASAGGESEPQGAAKPADSPPYLPATTRSEVSKATVRRAWQAAVIAAFSFPPLGFYSMRLLWKLARRATPLDRADKWRCWAAFFLNIEAILVCLLFAAALLFAFLRLFA